MDATYPIEETIEAVLKWNMRLPMKHTEIGIVMGLMQGRPKPIRQSTINEIETRAKRKIRAEFERVNGN